MPTILEGRVKRVNSKGYGFIETDQEIDFYFHHSAYIGDWKYLLQKYVSGIIIIVSFINDQDAPEGPRALEVKIKDLITK